MPIPKQFLMREPEGFASLLHTDLHANLQKDGRLVASENEVGMLFSIAHFGHLRVNEIAAAVWPDSPLKSGHKMARRTLRRLLEMREVLARPNGVGGLSFVLTKRGAARLKSFGFEFSDGYDIQGVQGPTFWHRTLATAYLISQQAKGGLVMGEYAIAKAKHSLGKTHLQKQYRKLPDGIVLVPGSQQGIHAEYVASWVECESSFKPDLELDKMLRHAWRLGEFVDARNRVLLDEMVIIYDGRANHEPRLIRAARRVQSADLRHRRDAGERDVTREIYQAIWSSVRLVAADILPPLQLRGWREKTLLDCMGN